MRESQPDPVSLYFGSFHALIVTRQTCPILVGAIWSLYEMRETFWHEKVQYRDPVTVTGNLDDTELRWNSNSTCTIGGDRYATNVIATNEIVCKCAQNNFYLLDELTQFDIADAVADCECSLLDNFQYCQCTEQFTFNQRNSTCVPVCLNLRNN